MVLVAFPAALLALVTVAAFLGRWSWFLDVLANFRPQYAVAGLALAAVLFLGRWRKMAAVALAAAVVNAVFVVPLFIGPDPVPAGGETLRILSFNLKASNDRFGDVIAFIRQHRPDVAFLHEASRPWEIALESADLGYVITKSRSEELIFGTLVLSAPDDRVTSYGFTTGGARAVEVEHPAIKLLGIHPLAPTTAERSALRNAQMAFASEWAQDQDGPRVVVGDFNSTPWSYPFRRLVAETGLRNSQRGFGIQPTFPTSSFFAFRVPIDHLLHSADVGVVDRFLAPAMGSDHFPLIVDVAVSG